MNDKIENLVKQLNNTKCHTIRNKIKKRIKKLQINNVNEALKNIYKSGLCDTNLC